MVGHYSMKASVALVCPNGASTPAPWTSVAGTASLTLAGMRLLLAMWPAYLQRWHMGLPWLSQSLRSRAGHSRSLLGGNGDCGAVVVGWRWGLSSVMISRTTPFIWLLTSSIISLFKSSLQLFPCNELEQTWDSFTDDHVTSGWVSPYSWSRSSAFLDSGNSCEPSNPSVHSFHSQYFRWSSAPLHFGTVWHQGTQASSSRSLLFSLINIIILQTRSYRQHQAVRG